MTERKKTKSPALVGTVVALCTIGVSRIVAVVRAGFDKMKAVFEKNA